MDNSLRLQRYFQILGDSSRLKIISFIGDKERAVSEIVNETKMSQPLVSHHLRILKESQLLETKRTGPFVYYKITNTKLLDVLGLFSEILPREIEFEQSDTMFTCPPWFNKFFNGF